MIDRSHDKGSGDNPVTPAAAAAGDCLYRKTLVDFSESERWRIKHQNKLEVSVYWRKKN